MRELEAALRSIVDHPKDLEDFTVHMMVNLAAVALNGHRALSDQP